MPERSFRTTYPRYTQSTMACPSVPGDNPRALASGLAYVQVDKHGITIFIPPTNSVDLANHELYRA